MTKMPSNLNAAFLYSFVDTAYLQGRDAVEIARQLCAGGSDVIQLRAKDLRAEEVERLAEMILPVTQAKGVPLVLNDYPSLAAKLGIPYCHLGQEDFFDAGHVRCGELPRKTKYGLSTHSPSQAERSLAAGPAYIAIGPVFPTGTKPGAKPVTLEYVRWAAKNVKIPWFAIGGINLQNLDSVLEAGARRICVVSAILNSQAVAGACQQFKQRLLSSPLS